MAFLCGMNVELRASWLAMRLAMAGADKPPAEAGAAEKSPDQAR